MARDSYGHQLIRSVIAGVLAIIVVLALIGGAAYLAMNQKPDIEDGSWLVLDLYGDMPEYNPPGSLPASLLADDTLTLQSALDAMAKATIDDRVEGVIWKMSASNGAGLAKLEELRQGITAVRDAGKPVYAWGDYMNLNTLFLASACDSIYMPNGGYCELRGMMRQSLYVRGLLDKLGVVPHISKIREYKGAAEIVMETGMTEPVRGQNQRLLDARWNTVTTAVAQDRGLPREQLLQLMEQAALLPPEAAAAGVIDRTLYWQDLEAQLLAGTDETSLPTVTPDIYEDVAWSDLGHKGRKTIAVVHAQGMIAGRESGVNPVFGVTMGHESVVRELRRARLDEDVEAIVFRIDSPGGEGLASNLIGHEVALCAAAKPTVVSMADVAASGGYQIAFRATRMLADPMSVVGSIGSISGFFDMSGLYEKIGVSTDAVSMGPMAEMGRDDRAPTAAEWEAFRTRHEANFEAWLRAVAQQRGMTFEAAEQLAYGRVFTGEEAVANGLIDGIGNLDAAVREAASLAGIAPEVPLTLVHLPEPQDMVQSLLGGGDDPSAPVTSALRWALYRQARVELNQTLHLLNTEAGLTPAVR